jgi:hypothetical protein
MKRYTDSILINLDPKWLTAGVLFASKDEARPILNGVAVVFKQPKGPEVTPVGVIATDSYRLVGVGLDSGHDAIVFDDTYSYMFVRVQLIEQLAKMVRKGDTCSIASRPDGMEVALYTVDRKGAKRRRVTLDDEPAHPTWEFPNTGPIVPTRDGMQPLHEPIALSTGLLADVDKALSRLGVRPYDRSQHPLVIVATLGALKAVPMFVKLPDDLYLTVMQMPVRIARTSTPSGVDTFVNLW